MEVYPREVRNYITEEGISPFEEWLTSLQDRQSRARIWARIAKLRLGNLGDYKIVGENLLELREHYGPGFRLYCGQIGKELVILLCGGDKKTQRQDIQTANEYWKTYLHKERENREEETTPKTSQEKRRKNRKK